MSGLTIALAEEIGNPNLFIGRKQELQFYLCWAEGTKNLLSRSQAILSRRKKGKTALVQRLFNILYSKNDPCVIPFSRRCSASVTASRLREYHPTRLGTNSSRN